MAALPWSPLSASSPSTPPPVPPLLLSPLFCILVYRFLHYASFILCTQRPSRPVFRV